MILIASIVFIIWSCNDPVISSHDGLASYYADKFQDQRTASGELYDTTKYTAAHRDLPFGQRIRVVRKDDGRSVIVKVNDRGPFSPKRIVDLSKVAARELGMLQHGLIEVTVEVLTDEN